MKEGYRYGRLPVNFEEEGDEDKQEGCNKGGEQFPHLDSSGPGPERESLGMEIEKRSEGLGNDEYGEGNNGKGRSENGVAENVRGKGMVDSGEETKKVDIEKKKVKEEELDGKEQIGGRVLRSRSSLKGGSSDAERKGVLSEKCRGVDGSEMELVEIKKERSDQLVDGQGEKPKGKRGRPPKSEKIEGASSSASGVKKLKLRRGRSDKVENEEIDAFDSKLTKKLQVKRGRPPKVHETDLFDGGSKKTLKRKRGRPPKVQENNAFVGGMKKKLKKRGRPPKVQENNAFVGGMKKKLKKRGRPPKVQESDAFDGGLRKKPKLNRGRTTKVQESVACDGESRTKLKHKRGRSSEMRESIGVLKRELDKKGKLGVKINSDVKLQDGMKQDAAANSSSGDKVLTRKESHLRVSSPEKNEHGTNLETKDNKASLEERSKTPISTKKDWNIREGENTEMDGEMKRRQAKNLVREKIKEILLRAGWTIEYRPRHGREYNDAVYVSPEGKTHWSVTLAYRMLKLHYENGDSEFYKTGFIFTPIPEQEFSVLKKVILKKREGKKKIKNEQRKGGNKSDGVIDKKKQKKKLNGMSLKRRMKEKSFLHEQEISAGKLHKQVPSYQQKTQGRKRCALLVRNSMEEADSDADGYVPYDGKRTVLAWMIDLGTVSLNEKVRYMNRRKTRVLLEGRITRDGIHCDCCSKIVKILQFETHAGSKLCEPLKNIYIESETSLLQCLLDSWNKQQESERKAFHFIDVNGEDPNDDTCGICGDGGNLICYHQSCDQAKDAVYNGTSSSSFCGKKCQELFKKLQKLLGVKHEMEEGFAWTLVRRTDVGSSISLLDVPQMDDCNSNPVECNSKLAVALFIMDECFLPIIDHRSGINLIHNIVYNCGSNFNRLNYSGFFTAILERDDEIISAASIRIHGNQVAEMPFIGTRHMYRRQGMCRRLLNAIENVLCSLDVERLVIPAISELRNTWTSVFGFKPLEASSKQYMKNINMLVFPGVEMLQKPTLKLPIVEDNIIITGGSRSTELKEGQTMKGVLCNANYLCIGGSNLNLSNEVPALPAVESSFQLPDVPLNDTSDLTSETTDLANSVADTKYLTFGMAQDNLESKNEAIKNPLGSVHDLHEQTNEMSAYRDAISGSTISDFDGRKMELDRKLNQHGTSDEESRSLTLPCIEYEAPDCGRPIFCASGESTESVDYEVKTEDSSVKNTFNCHNEGSVDHSNEPQEKASLSELNASVENIVFPDSEGKSQISKDNGNYESHTCITLDDKHSAPTPAGFSQDQLKTSEVSTDAVRPSSLTQNSGGRHSSLPFKCSNSSNWGNGVDTHEVSTAPVDSTCYPSNMSYVESDGPCKGKEVSSSTLEVTVDEVSTLARGDFLPNDVNERPHVNTKSLKQSEFNSQVNHASVVQRNPESLCNTGNATGVALHCASGGGNSCGAPESLVANEDFQHILRVLNTNVDGKQKIMFALTSIKGIGRRFANVVCKKADVDMNKSICHSLLIVYDVCYLELTGFKLSAAELDNLMVIVANPRQFRIPDWFLNRKKDYKDGRYSQVVSNALDMKLRDDLERLKKIRNHRGLRHYWGLRVRGQHTKTTGRRGKTVGVSKKR
ncbi:hypothetical protein FNV43_RR23373 [Rhamnella rubrinervis]|uniref:N-acetyltransferase domain-containing protein n=1 Tax=Rhamnella rubrinervis TaxID=2594499 RepID=A0A8K0DT76_9ROSA|nr:hypothetical protein FNV43_RR23373 [Rhamnella rubrinervis]